MSFVHAFHATINSNSNLETRMKALCITSWNDFFGLLNDLLHNLLNNLIITFVGLLQNSLKGIKWYAKGLFLLPDIFLDARSPCHPLIQQSSPMFNNREIGRGTTVSIFLVEDFAVFSEVLADLLLLLL